MLARPRVRARYGALWEVGHVGHVGHGCKEHEDMTAPALARKAAEKTAKAETGDAPGDAAFTRIKDGANPPPFLQNVSKSGQAVNGKSEPKLTRVAFKVSRLMEFCTRRELVNQTGPRRPGMAARRRQGIDRQRARRLRGGGGRAGHHGYGRARPDRRRGQRAAESTPRPSEACSTTRSGSRRARPMRPDERRSGERAQDHPRYGLRD